MSSARGSSRSHRPDKSEKRSTLHLEKYFHGNLPRSATNQYLLQTGDFLVRNSVHEVQGVQIIISMLHSDGRILHFPLNSYNGYYSLQGDKFSQVADLIDHYMRTGEPLTEETGAVIIRPIKRATWQMSQDSIDMRKVIGEGNYAIVYSGRMRTAEGKWIPAAIKKQNSKAISKQDKENFVSEAKLLLRLHHTNVVKIYGVCADTERILIVMELCTGGSLSSHLQNMANRLSESIKLGYCHDTAMGMKYLHSQAIIHRDLAARNCLLGSSGHVKISDFGLSKQGAYKLSGGTQTLPIRWSAPEVVIEGNCTEKSDIFSFAVLLWEVFTDAAKDPFSELKTGKEVVKALKQGRRVEFPSNTPETVKKLAASCFKHEPHERPSFQLICATFSLLTNRADASSESSRKCRPVRKTK